MTFKTQLCLCNIQGVGDFNGNFALLCISSDLYVHPEDGPTGKGRNM